jgi:hypothetical protein
VLLPAGRGRSTAGARTSSGRGAEVFFALQVCVGRGGAVKRVMRCDEERSEKEKKKKKRASP